MKEHTKKAFGLFGLMLVAITTVFAATLPVPQAIAATSAADTIVVRVTGTTPHVEFTGVINDSVFIEPEQAFSYIYDNIDTAVITLEYKDLSGNIHDYTLDTVNTDNTIIGSGVLNLNLSGTNYGYGDYVLRITGTQHGALPDEDSFKFSFRPFITSVKDDTESDDAILTLDYSNNTNIEKFEVIIRNEDSDQISEIPTITVTPPTKEVRIPFSENRVPTGKYIIEVISYDDLDREFTAQDNYEHEVTGVPNTGGLFSELNISKTDYLITGLVIFFLIGTGGIVFIAKASKNQKKRR